MPSTNDLIIDVLMRLVASVADQPRRVLFRGVSDLCDAFRARAESQGLGWDVRATQSGVDIVGARNNASIGTLVVFYRAEVQERESLNAFCQFNEDSIVEALIRDVVRSSALGDSFPEAHGGRLRSLLALTYPSIEQVAGFLLRGKDQVGLALPLLGLFKDPDLSYDADLRTWQARIEDNHSMAALRWREFLEKGERNRDARKLLGDARCALLRQAETDPSAKQRVLEQVEFREALQILNPPTQIVAALMQHGFRREEAERVVADVKAGRLDPQTLVSYTLPDSLLAWLQRLAPKPGPEPNGRGDDVDTVPRVRSCLEGVLRLARQHAALPAQLYLARDDVENGASAVLSLGENGRWQVTLQPVAARALSSVPAPGATELLFRICGSEEPAEPLQRFSLENSAKRIEPYTELWPEASFWTRSAAVDSRFALLWQTLGELLARVRDIVDPVWADEGESDEPESDHEPSNAIYMIFDLLYLANRDLFEAFLDTWLRVATLPWRSNMASVTEGQELVKELLQIGLAVDADDRVATLPFYPLRLVWHRAVIARIEEWLAQATHSDKGLEFEPSVLDELLQAEDRPRALFYQQRRLMETGTAPFFSLFGLPQHRHSTRAPLDRARRKLEQFGHMWPFSLSRLHLAFQPGNISGGVYQLLTQLAEAEREAAFRVRAVVDQAGTPTQFDQRLFTTGDDTTDFLTQEHHQSLFPLVDYAKGQLESIVDTLAGADQVLFHAALLVDVFAEDKNGFQMVVGLLDVPTHWESFRRLVAANKDAGYSKLKKVDLSAPSYHTDKLHDGGRFLVYVPLGSQGPEYLRLLVDSLTAWVQTGAFTEGAYYEHVQWDAESLERLHQQADWVIMFDRTLDKSLFKELAPARIQLIDFYPALRGGYRLSISSQRTDAVKWQLVRVLQQFFGDTNLDLDRVAGDMVTTLGHFASGLLLKTLGGGSLAQELIGLYATYLALIAEGQFVPGQDWLLPLDDYQDWFGRRTQRGRRADLLVLRQASSDCLHLLAVESKWYKNLARRELVDDEFGPEGQLRTAARSLRSLFDPQQDRLDRDYWQRTLLELLEEAPPSWTEFRRTAGAGQWELVVDGRIYVHQYIAHDPAQLAQHGRDLCYLVSQSIKPEDTPYFGLGASFERLRLLSRSELQALLGDVR